MTHFRQALRRCERPSAPYPQRAIRSDAVPGQRIRWRRGPRLLLAAFVAAAAPALAAATGSFFGGDEAPLMCGPAAGGDPACGAGPASLPGSGAPSLGAGNPLNVASGNKYQREVDLPPLPGVLGLEVVRHYNSHATPLLPMGRGWRLSYDTRVHPVRATLQIVQADGRRIIFSRNPANPSLCATADPAEGRLHVRRDTRGRETYRWVWPDGRRLDFGPDGRLIAIQAASGELLTLLRGPAGELLRVTDPQGRRLTLHYGTDPHGWRGITAIDTPLGRLDYRHATAGAGAGNLLGATVADGRGRDYLYEDARHPHALTGISAAGERLSTYGYDDQGRAVLSERAGGAERVTLAYGPAAGETVVTNSLGQTTLYRHAERGGRWRLLEVRGAGCAACGPPNRRYGYDAATGLLTAVAQLDGRGHTRRRLRYRRDRLGRVTQVLATGLAGTATAEQWLARYEYEGEARRPRLLARPSLVPGREHRLRFAYNAAGQPLSVVEEGFSPVDEAGRQTPRGTPIRRAAIYHYALVHGRSLLVEIDGPLPNGPTSSPTDSDITRIQWDALGRFPVLVTTPGGTASRLERDPGSGLLRLVKDNRGSATIFDYVHGQLVRLRRSGPGWTRPQIRRFRYDARGRPVERGHGDGDAYTPELRQAFDAVDRLQWQASPLGILSEYRYDSESRLVEARRASASMARARRYRYDAAGRLIEVADNAGRSHRLRYTAAGEPAAYLDALGRERPLTAATAPRSAKPDSAPRSQPDRPPAPWQLRDDFGRIVLTRSPDAGVVHRAFDEADRLTAMRDARGHRAEYAYDVRGRIVEQTVIDGDTGERTITRWHRDGTRLVALEHPTQRERYTYDARGLRTARIVTLPTPHGELTAATRYEHDADGRLTATTLPDGSRIEYRRNGQGQVVAVVRNPVRTPWLRWLAPSQTLAEAIERDVVGLRSYVAGNGVETRYERSPEGVLARVVHRRARPEHPMLAPNHDGLPLPGDTPQQIAERLLGIGAAHAAPASKVVPGKTMKTAAPQPPGALALPPDPAAFIDERYLWDAQGNLLYQLQRTGHHATRRSHAYDRRDRLIASVATADAATGTQRVWRYAYDAADRRVLAQEAALAQTDLQTGTRSARFVAGSHRRADGRRYTADGQPVAAGDHEYVWDAFGRLVEIRAAIGITARYGYDHRGLRNAKTVDGRTTRFLHDEQRRLLAEIDDKGCTVREYVWLADLPLAVIDPTSCRAPRPADETAFARIRADLARIAHAWFDADERVVWIHANHLGAPEAATDADGNVLWRADYAPFGAARIEAHGFTLNLRLPGQYYDRETGLHYNRARYYDPGAGQYLGPDPLGSPDGPNPYAYVAYNPLRYIDPDGLVLFAFDGTGNTDDTDWLRRNGDWLSNVVGFRNAYADGNKRYISGVGTVDSSDPTRPIDPADYTPWYLPLSAADADMGATYSGPARIERMGEYFDDEATDLLDDEVMDVDIIGFSRGAAQARDFANRIAASTVDGLYRYTSQDALGVERERCQRVNLRFLGLWDTVLSTNFSGYAYNLAIPDGFAYVAQAVALNEYRGRTFRRLPGSTGAFPVESIMGDTVPDGVTRIERGFLGSHADIGGGFGEHESQLATVALVWMTEQAKKAGVRMDDSKVPRTVIANPVIHDKSDDLYCADALHCSSPYREDREVRYRDGGTTTQMAMTDLGMSFIDTQDAGLIQYLPATQVDQYGTPVREPRANYVAGTVDMRAYLAWLDAHGYDINLTVTP